MFSVLANLAIFFSQGGLVAITMYTLICLSDLEQDFINPHDSSKKLNRLVLPEYALNASQAFLAVCTRNWILLLAFLGLGYFHFLQYQKKQHMVEVTEMFKQLPREKTVRLYKLGFYVLLFILVIYYLVLAFLEDIFPDEESREQMKKILASNDHPNFSMLY